MSCPVLMQKWSVWPAKFVKDGLFSGALTLTDVATHMLGAPGVPPAWLADRQLSDATAAATAHTVQSLAAGAYL